MALLDEALAVARDSDVGFHLMNRVYGTRIVVADSLAAVGDAEGAVRARPRPAPAAGSPSWCPLPSPRRRPGDLDRAGQYAQQTEVLATVVMRLPAGSAAVAAAHGHLLLASGDGGGRDQPLAHGRPRLRSCGQPLAEQRCTALTTGR